MICSNLTTLVRRNRLTTTNPCYILRYNIRNLESYFHNHLALSENCTSVYLTVNNLSRKTISQVEQLYFPCPKTVLFELLSLAQFVPVVYLIGSCLAKSNISQHFMATYAYIFNGTFCMRNMHGCTSFIACRISLFAHFIYLTEINQIRNRWNEEFVHCPRREFIGN